MRSGLIGGKRFAVRDGFSLGSNIFLRLRGEIIRGMRLGVSYKVVCLHWNNFKPGVALRFRDSLVTFTSA